MKRAGARLALLLAGILVFYLAGVLVRGPYGIRVLVNNQSGESLRRTSLKVERTGPRYELGEIAIRMRKHIFMQPKTESHINLEFEDGSGQPHTELVVGYAESGYCGSAEALVRAGGKVDVTENIDPVLCKGSWLDFLR